jgi:GSCFA family
MKHPYIGQPDSQFWKKEPGILDPAAFDPVSEVPFSVVPGDRVVTAGSCFAQHVARALSDSGFMHYITENAHPIMPDSLARSFGYGLFSARYGNLYTTRQLRQLIERAYGDFQPKDDIWYRDGRAIDAFRPQIQPGGFESGAELANDRVQHFAAIRKAFEEMDVFVFTLGLTECWQSVSDGAVYPLAPGVAGGTYDPATVKFRNFEVDETTGDLLEALRLIRKRNPKVRIILTVSPVPLNATMESRHVFVSTTWSKAVLRIAAERVLNSFDNILYFPSYEIITSPHVRGRYYAEDCREVRPEGVRHVMQLFFRHLSEGGVPEPRRADAVPDQFLARMQQKSDILCDEEAINNG